MFQMGWIIGSLLFLGSGFEFAAAGLLERLVNLMHKFILCKNDPLI